MGSITSLLVLELTWWVECRVVSGIISTFLLVADAPPACYSKDWNERILALIEVMLKIDVLRSTAIGLDFEENFFDSKINDQCHNLRLLSYPPVKSNLIEKDGQARAGAHSGSSVFFQEPFSHSFNKTMGPWLFPFKILEVQNSVPEHLYLQTLSYLSNLVHLFWKLLLTLKLDRNNYYQCWRFASTLEQRCPAVDTSPRGCTVC